MLKVNRKVEYGLVALKHMQGKPPVDLTSVREICEVYGTPFDPVAHVLRTLNANGILKSEQGAHGGYRLTENLHNINLAQFIEMIEGQLMWTECAKEHEDCKCGLTETCNIVSSMRAFGDRLFSFLESISVAELLQVNGSVMGLDLTAGARAERHG